jgi:hypothetical protein
MAPGSRDIPNLSVAAHDFELLHVAGEEVEG